MMTEVRVRPGVADGPCDIPAVDRARCFRSDVTDVSLAIGGLDDQVGAVEAPQVVRGDALRVDGIREVREVHRGKRLPVSQAEVMGDQRGFVSGGLAREPSTDRPATGAPVATARVSRTRSSLNRDMNKNSKSEGA